MTSTFMTQSPYQQPKTSTGVGNKLVVGLVVVISAIIGSAVSKEAIRFFRERRANHPPSFSANAWATRNFGDISIDAPFAFGPGQNLSDQLPKQVRDAVDYQEFFDSGDSTPGFRVAVSRFAYKPGIPVSLDGAVNGSVTSAAAAAGDHAPKFNTTTVKVNGLDGRRATYHGTASGQSVHMDSLFAQHGQKIWQVQIIYFSAASAKDSQRVLDSVRIAPSN